jgi:vanillate/3-O-methylgallate O-demethylase
MGLLWKPGADTPKVPVIPPEYDGWRAEQHAWEETVALLDLCHHMTDLFIEGPDAMRLLSYVSANNYEKFIVGQAKQFVCVTEEGLLIQDGILMRLGEQSFNLIGIGAAANWVSYHAQAGKFDVKLSIDPPSDHRPGNPKLFRYQVQGPKAAEMIKDLLGDKLDDLKFFHFREIELEGHTFVALRHGMAGQAGVEFSGDWSQEEFVRTKLLEVGARYGLVKIGGLSYYTAGVDSGWLATPVPAIYTSTALADYRKFVSLYSYEGLNPLHGSFYSPNIEDYYVSPYELGYGRSISFNHDFIGKEALQKLKENIRRKKVTLVWSKDDVNRAFGADHDLIHSYSKDRVQNGDKLVGISEYASFIDPAGEVHSLAVVDIDQSTPGTELTLLWGQHPGADAPANVLDTFAKIRVIVEPAPLNEHARTTYRGA